MRSRSTRILRTKRDANESDIISALRTVGAFVKQLDTPADLLVGFRRKWYFLEVKNPEVDKRDRQLTDDEKLFRDLAELHQLPYAVVETPIEALEAIGAINQSSVEKQKARG